MSKKTAVALCANEYGEAIERSLALVVTPRVGGPPGRREDRIGAGVSLALARRGRGGGGVAGRVRVPDEEVAVPGARIELSERRVEEAAGDLSQ